MATVCRYKWHIKIYSLWVEVVILNFDVYPANRHNEITYSIPIADWLEANGEHLTANLIANPLFFKKPSSVLFWILHILNGHIFWIHCYVVSTVNTFYCTRSFFMHSLFSRYIRNVIQLFSCSTVTAYIAYSTTTYTATRIQLQGIFAC